MATIVDNVDCQSEIGSLLLLADSVILYRSSPSQKAELLRMVKLLAKGRQICAVGDGANDVMMLQQADVGIGIMGKEGNQASQFADFAVTQFKDLRRLMFWHGSPFGGRIINFVNSILFKNFMIITTVVTNQFYCGFSGYFQIPDFLLAMFQINMTLILQACYVPFHKDMNFVKYPTPQSESDLPFSLAQLYVTTQGHIRRFGADYILNTAWAVFCGLFMHYQWEMVEREAIAGENGLVLGADAFGVFCIISCALIADLWILRHIRHWDWLQVFLLTFSLFWIPFDLWKEQSMVTSKVTGLIYPLLAEPVYSLNIALIVAVTLLPLWVSNRWRMVVVERIYFTE